ncbi:2-amino-4-hydroxy-6-hydroxymethyldihydropteridine diphosphokinase [uncultured Psychrobacter sp.]|uniref:2-amino-4-hydroxy-6- hydroxymethyldihydropteridine diphosphokinase n=1 Tax=uncultured Psychrobacter sp. TaxID=259303 RepID=UPI0026369520|nr:2-amino-4-hydroxy-6-hydroxymethyldihydropteridine diphosphokinase [uncultured Psychrobacter sp.]
MSNHWITCYLGLGSNLANELGSPIEHLQQALLSLEQHQDIRELRVSSYYASAPMGPQDQPDFINAVVEIETTLAPLALLALCQQLEKQAQRERVRRWGERSLDVDILLYGQQQIDEPALIVPHAGLHERNFMLVPLRELAPELMINGQPLSAHPLSADWSGLKLIE